MSLASHPQNLDHSGAGAKDIDYEAFYQWLIKSRSERVSRDYVNYAKRFKHCLFKRDLSDLMKVTDGVRRMGMFSLSALSKYLGLYDEWKNLVKRYDLKWAGKSKSDIMIERLTKIEDAGEVYAWILEVCKVRPELTEFMDLMAVTGLRLIEGIHAYNLIIELSRDGKLEEYYNGEALEHYKFKETFIRRNKKVFISFVPGSLVKRITENEILKSRDSVQKKIAKKGLPSRFGDIREAHATFMINFLKQPEIDFLHGRVSASVFMSNYFNPALIADLKTRTFHGINAIEKKII